jgi:PilZ domain
MIEVQRPAQTVLANHNERRKSPRTPIRRLAYVNLEPYDNGGVITDISADGLRFHTVNPVEHGGLVRLSVVLGAADQLPIVGALIWMDESRKVGGVRFTVLPDGAAERILQWAEAASSVSETAIPNVSGSSPAEPAQTAPEPKTRTAWVPPSARPAARNPIAPRQSPGLPNAGTEPPQAWANPGASAQTAIPPGMPWITHFDPDPPEGESLFLRGVLGGFVLFVLLGAAGWFGVRHYSGQNGPIRFNNPLASSPAPTDPLASRPDLSPAPSAELPNSSGRTNPMSPSPEKAQSASREAPDDATPETNSASVPEVSSSQREPLPQAPNSGLAAPTTLSADGHSPPPAPPQPLVKAPGSLSPGAADTGESQLRLARQYLDGHVQPRNPAVASQLLWSAVEKGNSAAEMDLADLYLHGDGVARNCDQARVLLSVASGKGNPEAMQKLYELDRSGCR